MRVAARLCPNASAQPDVQRAENLLGNEAQYLLGTVLCPLTDKRANAFRRVALGNLPPNPFEVMTTFMTETAQNPSLRPDKDITEPVNINDSFRKAKRNSLVWSSVTILAVLGHPVTREGDKSETALIPLYPLGIGFDQWMLVVIGLVVSIYMFVGFRRALHPIDLMNSQRFHERGLSTVPDAMRDLATEISDARRLLTNAVDRSRIDRLEHSVASERLNVFAKKAGKILNDETSRLRESFLQMSASPLKSRGDESKEMRGWQAFEMSSKWGESAVKSFDGVMKDILKKIEGLRESIMDEPEPFELDALTSAMRALSESADELTEYHRAIDKTDQEYLQNFDVEPTSALFSVALVLSSAWLVVQIAKAFLTAAYLPPVPPLSL